MLDRIISGGQTGADQVGWRAARVCGIPTGGFVPLGFPTEDGPRPEFRELYGAVELPTASYPARTARKVEESDGSDPVRDARLARVDHHTPGCLDYGRSCFDVVEGKRIPALAPARGGYDGSSPGRVAGLPDSESGAGGPLPVLCRWRFRTSLREHESDRQVVGAADELDVESSGRLRIEPGIQFGQHLGGEGGRRDPSLFRLRHDVPDLGHDSGLDRSGAVLGVLVVDHQ
jgi:hypothetical protein